MIGQTLATIFPAAGAAPTFGLSSPMDQRETVYDFFLRMKDELFWPRILVRSAPPPDEI